VRKPLLHAFPFPSTLGEVTLQQLSLAGLSIYSSRGMWVFPHLLWSFRPTATFRSFTTPGGWACAASPAFSSLRDFPSPPLQCSWRPALFAMCLFCCYCLLFSFFFSFFPGWGSVCPGAYADLAWGCCGSTACCLAHLVVRVFPSHLGTAVWRQHRSPPGFSV
jgi:hypothetical protein